MVFYRDYLDDFYFRELFIILRKVFFFFFLDLLLLKKKKQTLLEKWFIMEVLFMRTGSSKMALITL